MLMCCKVLDYTLYCTLCCAALYQPLVVIVFTLVAFPSSLYCILYTSLVMIVFTFVAFPMIPSGGEGCAAGGLQQEVAVSQISSSTVLVLFLTVGCSIKQI